MTYFIRALTITDKPFMWDMLYEALYVPENKPRPPRSLLALPELAKYVEAWGQPDDLGFVAIDTATVQPIGAVWLHIFTADEPGFGYVDDETPELSIALLPTYRGQGIGTALLKQVLNAATPYYRAVSLSVDPTNPARRLYERLGFQPAGTSGTSITMKYNFV